VIRVGDVEAFRLPHIHAALRRAGSPAQKFGRRTLTVNPGWGRRAASDEESQQEEFVLHRFILVQVHYLRNAYPCLLVPGLL